MKQVLITGANGQDGILLSRYLLELGYSVHGTVRGEDRKVVSGVIRHVMRETSLKSWAGLIDDVRPDEMYLLGADSFAGVPLNGISAMLESNVVLMAHLLEATAAMSPETKIFVAGSAAVFGDPPSHPQSERTPRNPSTLYGAAKALIHPMADLCRRAGQFVAVGILFNHESSLRPERFVTRKITAAAARIAAGSNERLMLGNLDGVRDWGHAADYVKAMYLMLQAETPGDWIVASGQGRTVREFCRLAFGEAGLDYRDHVSTSAEFWRPAEKVPLIGDPSRLENELGWRREKSFQDLLREMVSHDRELLARSRMEAESPDRSILPEAPEAGSLR